jgi:hypothetical protein
MRMMKQKIQNRHALRSRAQPFGSQGLNPVVGTWMMDRRLRHAGRIGIVLSYSI